MRKMIIHLQSDRGNACKGRGIGRAFPTFKHVASGVSGPAFVCCKKCLKIAGLKQQFDPFL